MSLEPVKYTLTIAGRACAMVRHMHLTEAIAEIYALTLEVTPQGDPTAWLGQDSILTVQREGAPDRRVCGVVQQVRQVDANPSKGEGEAPTVRLHIGPAFAALHLREQTRIFQEKTAPQIIEEIIADVLEPYGRTLRTRFLKAYAPREICTQWRESDLNFVHRLMAQEGMCYAFEHQGDTETIIITDDTPGMGTCPAAQVPMVAIENWRESESVTRFDWEQRESRQGVTFVAQDWTRPKRIFEATARTEASGHQHAVRRSVDATFGSYSDRAYSEDALATRAQAHADRLAMACFGDTGGQGTVIAFAPGQIFTLTDHPVAARNQRYLITSVVHASAGTAPESDSGDAGGTADTSEQTSEPQHGVYGNTFRCIPADAPCRPALEHTPCRSDGMQRAWVVGPQDEEIHTDAHGRVRVHFFWDTHPDDERATCWLPVVQPWAGSGFGAMFLPRVGTEVAVTFCDGNPDAPVVLGGFYNGAQITPYALPEHKTRTALRTRTSPGGDGYNELSFEDAAGKEEILLRAQRDFLQKIGADRSADIDGADRASVGGDRLREIQGADTTAVEGEQHLRVAAEAEQAFEQSLTVTVGGDARHTCDADATLEVRGNQSIHVAGDAQAAYDKGRRIDVADDLLLTCGKDFAARVQSAHTVRCDTFTVEAKNKVVLQQGDASITLSGGHVIIEGNNVTVNGANVTMEASDAFVAKGATASVN